MAINNISLTPEQREKILRDVWIQHDGRWFIKSVMEVGFEATAKINMAAARSIGKTEIKRFMQDVTIGKITNIHEFKQVMTVATALFTPEEHVYSLEIVDENTFVGHVHKCYVYNNVSKAGTSAIHRCSSKARFESWLQAFGLKGEVFREKDTSTCNGQCDIIFKIRFDPANSLHEK